MSHPEPPNDNGLPEVPPQPGTEAPLPSTPASPLESAPFPETVSHEPLSVSGSPEPSFGAPAVAPGSPPPFGYGQSQPGFGAPSDPQQPAYGAPVGQQPSPYGPGGVPPQGPGQFQYPAAPAPQPGSKKGLLIGGIIAGAVVILLVIGGGIALATGMFGGSGGPESAMKTYLGYIADGDAESAEKMVPTGLEGDEAAFLDPAVLKGATEFITDVKIGNSIKMGTDRFYVSYTYQLDGRSFDGNSEVYKKNGEWTLAKPVLASFSVGVLEATNFRIGDIEAPSANDLYSYSVYPGVYALETPKSGFYSGKSVSVVAGDDSYDSVDLKFTLSEKFGTEVQKAFNSWIDSCLTGGSFYGDDYSDPCHFVSLTQYEGITNMKATVAEYPVFTVDGSSTSSYLSSNVTGGKLQLDFDAVDRYDYKNKAVQHFSIQEDLPGYFSVSLVIDGSKITFEANE